MKYGFKRLQGSFSAFLIILTFTISVGLISPTPAIASVDFHSSRADLIHRTLSDTQLLNKASKFLNASPDRLCSAYLETDSATWLALEKSAKAAFMVTNAITHAAAAGAGTLTGYAGIASAVSQLGLGGLTTAVAGFMGSHVAGAAATSVVTSAIGGPVVMGTLLVGGAGAVAFGTYTLAQVAVGQIGLKDWAERHCSEIITIESIIRKGT